MLTISGRPFLAASLLLALAGCESGGGGGSSDVFFPVPVPVASVEASPEPTASPLPASPPVRFVALGDTGTGTADQMKVAAAVGTKCQADGCDFGILLGDNFYASGVSSATDPQFDTKFQQPYGGLGFPFYVVLGNHDYANGGSDADIARAAHQLTYAKTHDNFRMPSAHYVFDAGAASFFATDSHLLLRNHEGAVDVQGAFFRDALAQSDRPWKIALTHHAVFSNGSHGNAGSYDGASSGSQLSGVNVKRFLDETLCGEADLYLSGHDHNLQLLPGTAACPGTFVVSGAGGKASSLSGTNPTEFQTAAVGFTYLVVGEDVITIEILDADANVLHRAERRKPSL